MFLKAEKKRQSLFKQNTPVFSSEAQKDGVYKKLAYDFCLPREYAAENLFTGIRQPVIDYFKTHRIQWHGTVDHGPSNHLCDSQICCLNFLFIFHNQPAALAELLRPLFPTLQRVEPVETSGEYVAFEWIGERNYLGERGSKRTRGSNSTSADAAVRFVHTDGTRHTVLIEWKYTESYGSTSYKVAKKSGTDRTTIYQHLYDRDDFPLDKTRLPSFDALFYEPFYQLFRQQCLANEMEKAHEGGADRVSVLHIAPAANRDFLKVTSPDLHPLGSTVMDVWKSLLCKTDRFMSVSTESLFGRFQPPLELQNWWEYLTTRYSWVKLSV